MPLAEQLCADSYAARHTALLEGTRTFAFLFVLSLMERAALKNIFTVVTSGHSFVVMIKSFLSDSSAFAGLIDQLCLVLRDPVPEVGPLESGIHIFHFIG